LRPLRDVRYAGIPVEPGREPARAVGLLVDVHHLGVAAGDLARQAEKLGRGRRVDRKDRRVHLHPGGDAEDRDRAAHGVEDVPGRPVPAAEEDEVDPGIEERPARSFGIGSGGRGCRAVEDGEPVDPGRGEDVLAHRGCGRIPVDLLAPKTGEGLDGPGGSAGDGPAAEGLFKFPVRPGKPHGAAHPGNGVDQEADGPHYPIAGSRASDSLTNSAGYS